MPDPFVLVLLLSLVALALGLFTMDPVPGAAGRTLLGKGSALIKVWTEGFGNPEILKFGLQIILIVVDFPAPFGPRKPKISPSLTSKLILLTAVKLPNLRVRF